MIVSDSKLAQIMCKTLEANMISTLEQALERIKELEVEKEQLLAELEYYRNRNYGGRKKHNKAWMTAYNDFAVKYENGMSIMDIVAEGTISRRTAYRYKAYYDKQKKIFTEVYGIYGRRKNIWAECSCFSGCRWK